MEADFRELVFLYRVNGGINLVGFHSSNGNIGRLRKISAANFFYFTFAIEISTLLFNYTFMKNTPFTEKHLALGAKMASFAGFNRSI